MRTELEVGDLLVGGSDAERLAHLRAEGLADESGLHWVMDRAQELVHDDPRAAEALGRLCDQAAAELELTAVSAKVCYLQAQIVTDRGDLEDGLRLIGLARDRWRQAGQPTAALRTDLGRMQILDDLGRHTEALAVGEGLLRAVENIGPEQSDFALARAVRAHAIDNMGTAYGLLGEHERALLAYAQAEREYRELGLIAEAARPQANRGVELLALGRAREALGDLSSAITGFQESGDRMFAAKCRGYLAQAHQQLGEFLEALAVLRQARQTLAELGATAEATRLQLAMAETYLAIGAWPEARYESAEAARITAQAGMVHDAAMANFLLASAELGSGDAEPAASALALAGRGFDQVGDRQYAARTQLAQAEVAAFRGHRPEAVERAERAATELAAGGWLVPLASAQLRLSDLADDDETRSRHLDTAGRLIAELGLPQLRYQHRLRAARLDRRAGRLDQAEGLLDGAIEDLNRAAVGLVDHALRTAFRADRLAAYDELVGVVLDRAGPGDDDRAWQVAGEAKAATLRDLVSASVGAGPQLDRPGSNLAQAYADLGATYQALQEADEAPRRALLMERAETLEQQVSALRLREEARPVLSKPAPLRQASGAAAPPAEIIVEFHVSGNDLVVFRSGAAGRRILRIPGVVGSIAEHLDRLADQWTRFTLGSAFSGRHRDLLLRTTRELLAGLYDLMLAPVLDRGWEPDGPERMRIVPHQLTGQVPFAALYDGYRHLVERYAVTVAPTPGSIAPVRPDLSRALVVAVTDETAPAVLSEAAAVCALLPGARLLADDQATSPALAAAVPGSGLVHLACHGLFRRSNPLFSGLRLADRWITGAEILHLDLTGALVVLSACESGQHGRSAEPVGLGWAFLAAGASGVVVSQWMVHDDATHQLMGRFYRGLITGTDPAAALRTAQLETAADHPHPFFWAPFSYLAAPGPNARSLW